MSSPWFKCYPGDFLNGVSELRPYELAVYTIVLMRIYDEGGAIPDEPARIAKRCNMRLTACERALDALCLMPGKLVRENGCLDNLKARNVVTMRAQVSTKMTRNATKRWEKEAEKRNEINATPHASALPNGCERDANGMPTRDQTLDSKKPPIVPPPEIGYVFDGSVVRLSAEDLDSWRRTFSNIVNLEAELVARDLWLAEQPESVRKKWFVSTATWLRNRDAKTAQDGARPQMLPVI